MGTIKLKKSGVANRVPGISDLEKSELAYNYTDGVLYGKRTVGAAENIVEFAGSENPHLFKHQASVANPGAGYVRLYPKSDDNFYLRTSAGVERRLLTSNDLSSYLSGNGTANYIPKYVTAGTLGNSVIFEEDGFVGIGTDSPNYQLQVNGEIRAKNLSIAEGNNIATLSATLLTMGDGFNYNVIFRATPTVIEIGGNDMSNWTAFPISIGSVGGGFGNGRYIKIDDTTDTFTINFSKVKLQLGTANAFVKTNASKELVYDTNSYALSSHTHNYDNYQSWNLKTNGVQRTGIASGAVLDIVAGANIGVSYSAGGVVTINNTAPASSGTVTSVGLSMPNIFSISNSPITTSGSLIATFINQARNTFLAAPVSTSGVPSFRKLDAVDMPDLSNMYDNYLGWYFKVNSGTNYTMVGLNGTQYSTMYKGLNLVAGNNISLQEGSGMDGKLSVTINATDPTISGAANTIFGRGSGYGAYSSQNAPNARKILSSDVTSDITRVFDSAGNFSRRDMWVDVTTAYSTTLQTYQSVPGLSVSLLANTTYEVDVCLNTYVSGSGGARYALKYSSSSGRYMGQIFGTYNSTYMRGYQLALGTSPGSDIMMTTSGQYGMIIIRATIQTNSAGTLSVEHLKVTSGTSTIAAASFIKATIVTPNY